MRRFFSYGPVDPDSHYYCSREKLVKTTCSHLIGATPTQSGHYITVWAPRQTGKTWLMREVLQKIKREKSQSFNIIKINLEDQKDKNSVPEILQGIANKIGDELNKTFTDINNLENFQAIFKKPILKKPLILIMDEFDGLMEQAINGLVSVFRNIYISRLDEIDTPSDQKKFLLHSIALIGIRNVLGIENDKGSPFNVQRSLYIPNLDFQEVKSMFDWYQKEMGQKIHTDVIQRIFQETKGQPGLTSWFGELLTETYNPGKHTPITMSHFEEMYSAATFTLPNNNILNIISKVKDSPYKEWALELFKTEEKISFKLDNKEINYLYLNGVIGIEKPNPTEYYVRFSSPFVQKRLFNYFSNELFEYMGKLVDTFENLDHVINESRIQIPELLQFYNRYLKKNKEWLLKEAPRRKDLRVFEAIYHFSLYMYLSHFLKPREGKVYPEFPTGNDQIDLIIQYKDQVYGLEVKSFTHETAYKGALLQAAKYAKQLNLNEIYLVFFVDHINDESRQKYEKEHLDKDSNIRVHPVFIEIEN